MHDPTDLETVKNYLQENKDRLIELYDASGLGVGREENGSGRYQIVIYLKDKKKMPLDIILLDGIPLKFEVTGQFNLQT